MTFTVKEGTQEVLDLTQAIMLYGSGSNVRYVTLHDIEIRNGKPEVCAGQPMTKDTLMAICKSVLGAAPRFGGGVLPANVLASGTDYLVWYEPSKVRTLYFDCRDGIGKRAGRAVQPGLIFAVSGSKWRVYATKGRGRPDANTPLYHAPYMNVWSSGQICVGSTPTPQGGLAENIEAWTDAFFASNFSHTNHQKPVKYSGGCHKFWADMLDSQPDKFPNKVLVKSDIKNLGDLIDIIVSE